MTISSTDITDNYDTNTYLLGGGLYLTGIDEATTFKGGSISSNTAANGGGVSITGGAKLTISEGAEINGNTADSSLGGGINCILNAEVTIEESYIQGNKSQQHGGGIYIASSNTVTLTNSIVTGNSTGDATPTWEKGGGIANGGAGPNNPGGDLNLYNTTIAGNYGGTSGGLHASSNGGTETVLNSIIWHNQASTDPNISSAVNTVDYSDIEGGYTGTGNMGDLAEHNPDFVDLQQASPATPTPLDTLGDFHLTDVSPCIDAGGGPDDIEPDPPLYDIDDGSTRPQGSGYDMGADEYGAP